jgi:hypothetical protein
MYYIYHIVDKVTRFIIYIGSTGDINHRFITHKSYCHNPNSSNYNQPIYQFIRAHGGFQNYECVEVFRLPDYCKNMIPYIEREEIINNLMTVKNKRHPRVQYTMRPILADNQ